MVAPKEEKSLKRLPTAALVRELVRRGWRIDTHEWDDSFGPVDAVRVLVPHLPTDLDGFEET